MIYLSRKYVLLWLGKQINEISDKEVGFFSYVLPSIIYLNKRALEDGLKRWVLINFWLSIMFITTLLSSLKKNNTREGWLLRAKR